MQELATFLEPQNRTQGRCGLLDNFKLLHSISKFPNDLRDAHVLLISLFKLFIIHLIELNCCYFLSIKFGTDY